MGTYKIVQMNPSEFLIWWKRNKIQHTKIYKEAVKNNEVTAEHFKYLNKVNKEIVQAQKDFDNLVKTLWANPDIDEKDIVNFLKEHNRKLQELEV